MNGKEKLTELVLAGATATAAAVGSTAVAIGLPILGPAVAALRERRLNELWRWVSQGGEDAEAFTERIHTALVQGDGHVAAALLAAARAATEAFDPIVLPSIGLLTRRFLRTRSPSRRVYRNLLEILTTLEADEFGDLRRAVHTLRTIPAKGDHIRTNLIEDSAHGTWNWYAIEDGKTFRLILGEPAVRVVDALTRLGSHQFSITLSSQAPKPTFRRDMIALLAEIMP